MTRLRVLPWHVFLGLYTYGLAVATAETGLLEKLTFLQARVMAKRGPGEHKAAAVSGCRSRMAKAQPVSRVRLHRMRPAITAGRAHRVRFVRPTAGRPALRATDEEVAEMLGSGPRHTSSRCVNASVRRARDVELIQQACMRQTGRTDQVGSLRVPAPVQQHRLLVADGSVPTGQQVYESTSSTEAEDDDYDSPPPQVSARRVLHDRLGVLANDLGARMPGSLEP
ncbi:cytochrome b reductase [Striga asiatica]|uniref:Cytochrome b reductase n=1 Tax=Striga asiatica TaxID=4170 RepID=A0A5A7PH77_STRAF|nr:cytochrome b reductase [Striga asiatica]